MDGRRIEQGKNGQRDPLAVLNHQEEIAALGVVLREAGLLPEHVHESARQRMKQQNRAYRESIEKIGVQTVDDFLRAFEGPIQ
jgi:hypothetical protein